MNIKLEPIYSSIEFKEMSDETYFSPKYGKYISNSKLALINPEQGGSIELYKSGFPNKLSDSLLLGSRIHEQVLQPDEFIISGSTSRPTAKLGAVADYLYKLYKVNRTVTIDDVIKASDKIDYYKNKIDENRYEFIVNACKQYWEDRLREEGTSSKEITYLDEKNHQKCMSCLDAVKQCKEIQDLLHPVGMLDEPISMNEAALFVDVKATDIDTGKSIILQLKAKLDNFTIDKENNILTLNDLKTTRHWLNKFYESMNDYHYYRQMGWYMWLLKLYAQKYHNITPESMRANMLVVSTVPDYRAGVFKVTKEKLTEGFEEFVRLLKMVAEVELNEQ